MPNQIQNHPFSVTSRLCSPIWAAAMMGLLIPWEDRGWVCPGFLCVYLCATRPLLSSPLLTHCHLFPAQHSGLIPCCTQVSPAPLFLFFLAFTCNISEYQTSTSCAARLSLSSVTAAGKRFLVSMESSMGPEYKIFSFSVLILFSVIASCLPVTNCPFLSDVLLLYIGRGDAASCFSNP